MKTGLTALFIFFMLGAAAQHKQFFFDNIYFTALVGNQEYKVDNAAWKNMYASRPTIPYLLDTMKYDYISAPKDGPVLHFNIHPGVSLMAGKSLINKTSGFWRNKQLEWRTGFLYKNARYNPWSNTYVSFLNFPTDSTKTYTNDRVTLTQEKQLIEWQNMLHFKTGPFLKTLRFVIGSGMAINTTLTNNITEQYNQVIYTWSSSYHSFQQQYTPRVSSSFKAKPETRIAYVFYLGTEYKLSKRMGLIGDFHYTLSHNKYAAASPKTDSYWVGVCLSYALN